MTARIIVGDALASLRDLADRSVQTCVTSPPYFGLRDYGVDGQIGLEATPDKYVARLVAVFREVRRVLRDDGTLWLNLGDSYAANRSYQVASTKGGAKHSPAQGQLGASVVPVGLKPKDLLGIPWRVAFALQADGWYLRSDIVWHKPNPMPESVTDRPTKSHEYVFLLTKSERYYYDGKAIEEPAKPESAARYKYAFGSGEKAADATVQSENGLDRRTVPIGTREYKTTRNARTVWTITTKPYRGAHFATMPPALAERCVLAGSKPGDTVLDPFGGAGTTGLVASACGRDSVLIELNGAYADLAEQRIGAGGGVNV